MKDSGRICGIYKIISPSNRVYIGQSVDVKSRWRTYLSLSTGNKGQILLYKSLTKYSPEKHTFEIIEECSVEDLNCRERYWQDFYDVLNGGLNLVLQECGEQRRIFSQESSERKSIASSGERNGMYGRCGELNPNWGKIVSEEIRKQQSERMKGKYTGTKNPFYGKEHTSETKELLSENAKKKVGVLNPFYGKSHTEDYKIKSSKRTSEFFKNNPHAKQHLKELYSIGVYHTPQGEFISQRDAARGNNVTRNLIKSRCVKNSDKPVGFNYQTPVEFRGEKTWKQHGWYFTGKETSCAD